MALSGATSETGNAVSGVNHEPTCAHPCLGKLKMPTSAAHKTHATRVICDKAYHAKCAHLIRKARARGIVRPLGNGPLARAHTAPGCLPPLHVDLAPER